MSSKLNLVNQKYGKLTVIKEISAKWSTWLCKCECGKEKQILQCHLRSGHTTSCGCVTIARAKLLNFKHGFVGNDNPTPEYSAWLSMKARCYNPNNNEYHNYGGRGIKVCDRWLNSFETFLKDLGSRPSNKHSLDRFPNKNGDYEVTNCRWATIEQQNNNLRTNKIIIYNGIELSQAQWAKKLKTRSSWIIYHLNNGKSFEWIVNRASLLKGN